MITIPCSAPKCLCDHIRPLISASSLRPLRSPNTMIFTCLVVGQPWPTLHVGPLLLLVRHSGITSLLLFAHLFSLLPSPRLSLALSLTFFLELKALPSGLHREKHYINIYIQC